MAILDSLYQLQGKQDVQQVFTVGDGNSVDLARSIAPGCAGSPSWRPDREAGMDNGMPCMPSLSLVFVSRHPPGCVPNPRHFPMVRMGLAEAESRFALESYFDTHPVCRSTCRLNETSEARFRFAWSLLLMWNEAVMSCPVSSMGTPYPG